jgi:hypothetical protein
VHIMPWHSRAMGTRALALAALLLALTACSGDPGQDEPGSSRTTDADCATRIPDKVFDTLRWSPPKAAEATVRGCHRETEQGYVEVRERTGYDKLCASLDRSGGVAPGTPVDWLGGDVTACAVEPTGDTGTTKVVVKGDGDRATQVTVTAVTSTDRDRIRAAIAELVG